MEILYASRHRGELIVPKCVIESVDGGLGQFCRIGSSLRVFFASAVSSVKAMVVR